SHGDPEAGQKQADEIAFRESGEERRYSWDYDENYEIWERDLGTGALVNLTMVKGYDAEGSYSPDGGWVAFASNRQAYDGSLPREGWAKFKLDPSWAMEIYRMRADGSGVERLTDAPGYDGGPFFSADGKKICWRRFSEDGATAEIWSMDADGKNQRPLTTLGAMSWAPYFHPSGDYLIFATNLQGFANFELYLVDAAGEKEPVRVTTTEGFDGLPAFSPDGDTLAWTSNRTAGKKSQIFVADWNHEAALEALGGGAVGGGDVVAAVERGEDAVSADDLRRHIERLASDEMGGRLTGTEGERKATAYAAKVFEGLGLEPAGDGGGWFEEFDFTAGVDLGEGNVLEAAGKSWEVGKDWLPLSFSVNGDLGEAEVVFAGYGIEAPEQTDAEGRKWEEYSSYIHLNVKDKWVLLYRYLPEAVTAEERQRYARFFSLRYKAMVARQKGAKGIIVASGPKAQVKSQLVPLTFDASLAGSGVGAISVTDEVAQALLDAAERDLKLDVLQGEHDGGEIQAGITLKGVNLKAVADVVSETKTGRNVLARLAGGGGGAAVLVGAHIDHLGEKAGSSSRAKDDELGKVHYGADDNASGTAAVFEIAELLAAQKASGKLKLKRDVVFAAWSGEEIGLIGSAHFAESAAEGLPEGESLQTKYVACLNMDMVGRLEKSLVLQGVGSSDFWPGEIERRNAVVGLPITVQTDSFLPTDATSFYLKGVPILNAFTGAHEDYHRPSDTVDKINFEGAEKIATFMALVARGLATTDVVPVYQAIKEPEKKGVRAALRAYLGTIPDYAQGDESGVKLSGVAKGGPADKAGVKGGDVIISLAGKEVKNIYDYTYVIEAVKIGEEIELKVTRKGKEVVMKITPGSRD
ncbi:MAG: M20/M25/M40 family metallo-hydrolase, partial [Verrucomicrobiales bacterium]|nr:M20/M25/M40 family metallo-hydrolase [Verrucomicrobiales bacterium]